MQTLHVPFFGIGFFRDGTANQIIDDVVAHTDDFVRDVGRGHQFLALVVDHLALVVHHIVELQQVLADFEVTRFDFLLSFFQGLVDPRMDNGFAFFKAQLDQHGIDAFGAEDAHQIVLQR